MRLLLAPEVDRDAVDGAARTHGWQLLNIFPATPAGPRRVVFGTAEWLLAFVDDPRVGALYALIIGHDTEAVAEQVRASLPTRTLAEVETLLAIDRPTALRQLGLVQGPPRRIRELLLVAAQSKNERVGAAVQFARDTLAKR